MESHFEQKYHIFQTLFDPLIDNTIVSTSIYLFYKHANKDQYI